MRSFGVKSISQVHFIGCKLSHVNIEVNNLGAGRRLPPANGCDPFGIGGGGGALTDSGQRLMISWMTWP
jgi:hypothetical protein